MSSPPLSPKVIIVHGTCGSPSGNWFPWLSAELTQLGAQVCVPRFPTPEGQSLDAWMATFIEALSSLTLSYDSESAPPVILVGHSIGAAFVLRVLESHRNLLPGFSPNLISAAFLVAPFAEKIGLPDVDELNKTFISAPFDWKLIKSHVKHITAYSGDNDPYVKLKLSQQVADNLGVELKIIKNGGHLNAEFGYLSFEPLLRDIRQVLTA